MQDATNFSTAAQVESVKLSPSGVFCASSFPSWAVLGPQASEDLAVGLASACLRRQDEFPLPTGSSASGWLGRSTLPADTQIYTKSTDFKNPYAHVHATHTEQRFTALEMLPLLQIYSLKSERCPSWDGPGGVW